MGGIDAREVAGHSIRTAEGEACKLVQKTASNNVNIRLSRYQSQEVVVPDCGGDSVGSNVLRLLLAWILDDPISEQILVNSVSNLILNN